MKKIIERYKDKNGYIDNFLSLYNELVLQNIPNNVILVLLKEIEEENKKIIKQLDDYNKRIKKVLENKEKDIVDIEYKKDVIRVNQQNENETEYIDVSFYMNYIEDNKEDKKYLDILPINNDKESIKIIDVILSSILKEINTINYLLVLEEDEKSKDAIINELITYKDIFDSIKKYKEDLCYVEERTEESKNEIVYYMNGENSYIYTDIVGETNSYSSIKILLESIENGTFKNIKQFTSNDKFKGLYEVRDLRNGTRVFFEPLGNKKYCVIYAITDKKETNQLYKQRLYLRYKKYNEEKELIKSSSEVEDIKKLVRGE